MNKKSVYIRADGSQEIGLGHLVRCLALAHMLKKDFDISFFAKEIPQTILKEITQAGFAVNNIDKEEDFLNGLTNDVVVVLDHYDLNTQYQKKIKETGCKLVCIDDLHDKEFYADLVINHAPGISSIDYRGQSYTNFALGIEYVLLRPAFLKAAREKKCTGTSNSVLICFGGADPHNFTLKSLEIVLAKTNISNIIVVTGSAFLEKDLIDSISLESNRTTHLSSLNELEMMEVLRGANIAIVPSSGILFEALATGCKVICFAYMQNQINIFESCKRVPSIYPINNLDELETALTVSLENNHPDSIDGRSNVRILRKFKDLL